MIEPRGSTTEADIQGTEGKAAKEARLAWEAARIEEALADARAGRVISHAAIKAWVNSWDTPGELPPPQAGM